MLLIFSYINLILISFLAATILPFSSEILLSAMVATDNYNLILLLIFASLGNISGSIINFILGKKILILKDKKWFPVSPTQLSRSQFIFNKYGVWSILLAWVPIIGDPITILSGTLNVNFFKFLLLVSISKISRYVFLIYILHYLYF